MRFGSLASIAVLLLSSTAIAQENMDSVFRQQLSAPIFFTNGTPTTEPSEPEVAPVVSLSPQAETILVGREMTLTPTADVPVSWTIESGPTWLSVSSDGTRLIGTPPDATAFSISVRGTASNGLHDIASLSDLQPVAVLQTTSQTKTATARTAFSAFSLTSSGGKGPISWSSPTWSPSAPPGTVSVSPSGQVTGTINGGGTYTMVSTATDSSTPPQTAMKSVQFTVTDSSPLGMSSSKSGAVYQARAGSAPHYATTTWTATNAIGAYSFGNELGGTALPGYPGLTINTTNGSISGTSSTASSSVAALPKLYVRDSSGRSAERVIQVHVAGPTPTISMPPQLAFSTTGYGQWDPIKTDLIGRSGFPNTGANCTIVSGSVPPGMNFNTDCALFGTPTTAGTRTLNLRIHDQDGRTADTGVFTITVAASLTADQIRTRVSGTPDNHLYDSDASTGLSVPSGGTIYLYSDGKPTTTSFAFTVDKGFSYVVKQQNATTLNSGTALAGDTIVQIPATSATYYTIQVTSTADGNPVFFSRLRGGYNGQYAP